MLVNHLFESSYGAKAGVETIRQLLHAVKDSKDIDLKVGPEMFPVEYGDARYLLQWWKANRHLGDAVAKYYGDANWIEEKLAKRDTVQSPDRLKQFDKERFAESDYKGWKYSSYDEDYGDNRKTSHVATKDGKEVDIDWSPYNRMSDEQFKTWVDLGMPTRKDVDSIGPLQPEDLEALMKTKLGTKARLAQEEQLDEILPALGAIAGITMVGRAASPLVKKVAGAAGSAVGSEIEKKFEEGEELGEYDSHNVGKGQYSDFEVMRAIKVAQDHHDDMTHAIDKIEAIKPGLSNHRAVKDELRRQNEDKDDITKKLDPKTKVALKKQQMKTAGITKGDPIAAMAMGLEKDVNRLDKENDEEEADIAAQELVDKYHSQELDKIRKMLDTLLKR